MNDEATQDRKRQTLTSLETSRLDDGSETPNPVMDAGPHVVESDPHHENEMKLENWEQKQSELKPSADSPTVDESERTGWRTIGTVPGDTRERPVVALATYRWRRKSPRVLVH